MKPVAVVAFGGNALLRSGQTGTFEEQLENVESACDQLIPLLKQGYGLVIGHGNGPQVGNALLRHEPVPACSACRPCRWTGAWRKPKDPSPT